VRTLRRQLAAAAVLTTMGVFTVIAPAAAHAATKTRTIAAQDSDIQISEVESNGGMPDDWIELHNLNTTDAEDLTGWWLQDNDSTDHYDIATGSPTATVIPAGGYLAFDVSFNDNATPPAKGSSPQYFGLGGADSARVFDASNNLVDHVDWTQHADDPITGGGKTTPDATYSRCPGTHGESGWVVTDTDTKAAANTSCPAPSVVDTDLQNALHVNEVMASNASDTNNVQLPDWIELTNTGTVSQDLSGWVLSDDKATDADYLPPGSVLGAGGYLSDAVGVASGNAYASQDPFLSQTFPGKTNVDFGLGASGDNAALLFPNDTTDVDRVVFGGDDGSKPAGNTSTVPASGTGKTIGRCPDGTGAFAITFTPTETATNQCANPADSQVKLNEVDTSTGVVELKNVSTSTADVSGWILKDTAGQTFTIPASTTIAQGTYATFTVGAALSFAASGDSVTLLDGTTTVDSTTWDHALTTSWGRCPDGTGSFADTAAATDGATNNCTTAPASPYDSIRINEIETNGDEAGDWIELANVGSTPVNISGMILADDGGDNGSDNGTVSGHNWPIPGTTTDPTDTTTSGNTVLAAGGFTVFFSNTQFGFGLGAPDMARLFTPLHVLIDSTAWQSHESGVTYERCPGATQASTVFTDSFGDPFVNSWTNSPGAANDCLPPIRINEVQASDPTGGNDWVELTNVGNQPVDLTGYILSDDSDADEYVVGGAASDTTTLAPGAFAAYNVDDSTHPGNFGLGKKGDEVRLYEPGSFNTTTSTYNNSDLIDSFVFENTSTLANPDEQLPQTVTLPNGTWPVNSTNALSPMTYARCSDGTSQVVADGTGAWAVTSTATKGAANQCDGLLTATPWPDTHNGQADTTADSVDLGQNMSGLFYVAGATPADDYMWGIENGSSGLSGANPGDSGELFKLVKGSGGTWGPATGWEKGVPVRYLNGQGEPDSEGVTAVHGNVFVASERDNANDAVSKISVQEFNPNDITARAGDADGDLIANHEWDLGPVLGPGGTANTGLNPNDPGDANLGIEGVAFVPDSYLTGAGFVDQSTGQAYDPADYPSHVDGGVFFVAMEKTGKLYGFVFNSDNTFSLVATVNTGFPTIMDVLWDPAQKALWATCDNTCQGRSSIIKLDTASGPNQGTFQPVTVNERPTGATTNLNNEGFTEQPASECANGTKSVWWSDDTDDNQHWLRTASVDCTGPPSGEVGATVTANVSGTPSSSGWYNAPVTVTFTCSDVDAVLNQTCPDPVQVSSTTTGSTVATLTDTLGLTYQAQVPPIQIDTTPPLASNISITSGPSGAVNSASASFGFTSSDTDVVGFLCKLDGVDSAFTACDDGTYSKTGLADGSYTFEVKAVDHADNVSDAKTQTFVVDTTAPSVGNISITSGPSGPVSSASASFGFASSDSDVTGFLCKLDGVDSAFVACDDGTYAKTGLADGSYTFEVEAVDHVGNVSAAKSQSFVVDTTAPLASSISVNGPAGVYKTTSVSFTFSSTTSDVTGFLCKLVGADTSFAACDSGTYSKSGLADGVYTFEVEAVDHAGNVSAPTSNVVMIDTIKPVVKITGVASGATYVGVGPTAKCRATDSGSGVASCDLKTTRTPTSVKVTATARDEAGNAATTTVSYRTVPYYVKNATYKNGVFMVTSGHKYTVVALTAAAAKPTLIGPVATGKKLTGSAKSFASNGTVSGLHEYTVTKVLTIKSGTWRLGVKIGGTTHVIELHRG
jgi:Lamin Tail Domain/Bacterial Ig-like domain